MWVTARSFVPAPAASVNGANGMMTPNPASAQRAIPISQKSSPSGRAGLVADSARVPTSTATGTTGMQAHGSRSSAQRPEFVTTRARPVGPAPGEMRTAEIWVRLIHTSPPSRHCDPGAATTPERPYSDPNSLLDFPGMNEFPLPEPDAQLSPRIGADGPPFLGKRRKRDRCSPRRVTPA